MTDPIADMLTRIRNAQAVQHQTVVIPFSKLKYEIAKALERNGKIKEVDVKGRKIRRILEITLKYDQEKKPMIIGLKRISKSGQRIYMDTTELQKVHRVRGFAILSTSHGIMTAREALEKKIGGEVLCRIW